jgi:hypothetical protein
VTPEEAAGFREDDEDPAVIFARFDAGPHGFTAPDPAEQIRRGLAYIRDTYGGSSP